MKFTNMSVHYSSRFLMSATNQRPYLVRKLLDFLLLQVVELADVRSDVLLAD